MKFHFSFGKSSTCLTEIRLCSRLQAIVNQYQFIFPLGVKL